MNSFERRVLARNVFHKLGSTGVPLPLHWSRGEYSHEENNKIRSIWKAHFDYEKYKFEQTGRFELPLLVINLTTRCSLKCKYCSVTQPGVPAEKHQTYNLDDFKNDLKKLLNAVNGINELTLSGGEPLLLKNLHEYLEYALGYNKIKRIWITTNGTIIPPQDLVAVSKKRPGCVNFSVTHNSHPLRNKENKVQDVCSLLRQNGIRHNLVNSDWIPTTPPRRKNMSIAQLEGMYAKCLEIGGAWCTSMNADGVIAACHKFHYYDLQGFELDKSETIRIRDIPEQDLREALINFYMRSYYKGCAYCDNVNDACKPSIKAGEQLP